MSRFKVHLLPFLELASANLEQAMTLSTGWNIFSEGTGGEVLVMRLQMWSQLCRCYRVLGL